MDLEDRNYWKSLINMSLMRCLILESLCCEPSHGYAILEKVKHSTQGCCVPTYGAIYPVLKQLVKGGYATSRLEIVGGRKRRVYELTAKGVRAYYTATQAWRDVLPYILRLVDEASTPADKV